MRSLMFALGAIIAVLAPPANSQSKEKVSHPMGESKKAQTEKATFGGGCFWCTEAVYQRIKGVQSVVSGYSGGSTVNPTYRDVSDGSTGHAEVIQIEFDPGVVSYEQLVGLFWEAHDPTTRNRQGNDVGPQYRSVIFYHDQKQKEAAERSKSQAQKDFSDPIVTEISPFKAFYKAENYHQDYYDNNKSAPYCTFVITPKLKKLGLE